MKAMNKVWVIGDASVDLVPEKQNSYLKCPGGASANVGVCVARLGGECGFIGCLGDDDAGRFLRQVFQDNGVDVTFLRLDADLTSAVLIVNLTADGERSFTYLVHPGLIPTFRRRTCRRSGSTNGFTSAQLASPTGPLARRALRERDACEKPVATCYSTSTYAAKCGGILMKSLN